MIWFIAVPYLAAVVLLGWVAWETAGRAQRAVEWRRACRRGPVPTDWKASGEPLNRAEWLAWHRIVDGRRKHADEPEPQRRSTP